MNDDDTDDDDTTVRAKKRVLRDISISRIAAVDAPAQAGALATILKRVSMCEEIPADVAARMTPAQCTQAERALAEGRTVEVQTASGETLATAKRAGSKSPARDDAAAVVKVASYHQELRDAKTDDGDEEPKDFQSAVHAVARRDRVKRSVAMGVAAKEFPKLYASYQQQAPTTAKVKAEAPVKTSHTTQMVTTMHDKWVELVNTIAERDKIPKHRAMAVARQEQPDVYQQWIEEGNRSAKKMAEDAARPIAKSDAVTKFDKMVLAVMARDGCNRLEAMQTAARLFPELRQRYADATA